MAVLKPNGIPGQLELTFATKVVGGLLTAVLIAGTLGSLRNVLTTQELVVEVTHLKSDVSKLLDQRELLRDRVSKLEGRHESGGPP